MSFRRAGRSTIRSQCPHKDKNHNFQVSFMYIYTWIWDVCKDFRSTRKTHQRATHPFCAIFVMLIFFFTRREKHLYDSWGWTKTNLQSIFETDVIELWHLCNGFNVWCSFLKCIILVRLRFHADMLVGYKI